MDPRLQAYVERVDALLASAPEAAEVPARVQALARELLAGGVEIDVSWRAVPDAGYGRNLVWRDPRDRFVLVAMVWPPGVGGPPHDHGTWGVVSVLEGRVQVTDYVAPVAAPPEVPVELRARCSVVAEPGQCAHVAPPPDDWHAVGNASDVEPALTLHTYGRDIERCRVFDVATGTLETVEPRYTNGA